jgi:folate-binding protein YgfZ
MSRLAPAAVPEDYRAAREGLAHRVRPSGILDVGGPDRVAFLQGQLTQDVRSLAPGEVRPGAALTPKGKLLFIARVLAVPGGIRLLLPRSERETALAGLKKFVVFQKVEIADRSDEIFRIALYGPRSAEAARRLGETVLPSEGEIAAEILASAAAAGEILRALEGAGSVPLSEESAEILRVEAGRPRYGKDADLSNLADEVGLDSAISTTKGCYVGQEVVARVRTYGRVNRRLVGFRFPGGILEPGSLLRLPQEPEPQKIEQGRVTSAVFSPRFEAIGLGYAYREVLVGGLLVGSDPMSRSAVVTGLPFGE